MEISYEEIYSGYTPQITFEQVEIPVIVVFSAIPGSGKSELTKRIISKYGFLGIANKDIRNSIKRIGYENDIVIGDYTLWMLDKLIEQKKYGIVLDRNIDQWYEPVKNWADENKYKLLVVKIEVSRENIEKRLRHREGKNVSRVLQVLDFYRNQHKKIAYKIHAEIVLKEDFDLDRAAKKIAEVAVQYKLS